MFREYIEKLPRLLACQIRYINVEETHVYVRKIMNGDKLQHCVIHINDQPVLYADSDWDYLVYSGGKYKIIKRADFDALYELSIDEQISDSEFEHMSEHIHEYH